MWWLVYLVLTLLLSAIARGGRRLALFYTAAGLVSVQAFKADGMGDAVWIAFAAVWVCVAGAVWRHSGTTSLIIFASAACYLIGRLGGFEFAPGSPMYASPLFWADMALIGAIIRAGLGPQIVGLADHVRSYLVGRVNPGRGDYGAGGVGVATKAGTK